MASVKSIKSPNAVQPITSPVASLTFLFIQVISLMITIVINWAMISWINKLEKIDCKCSKDWKRPALQYWAYFAIVFSVMSFALNLFFYFSYGNVFKRNQYFAGVVGLFSFMNMVGSLMYIYNLKSIDCECSEDMRREIIYVYNWMRVAIMLLGLIIFAYFVFILTSGVFKRP